MKSGRLDRRISILRKTVTLSPSGMPIATWTPLALRVWAGMTPVRGDERLQADQYLATEQTEFQIRWSPALQVTPLDRIVYPALQLADLEGSPPEIVPDATVIDRRQYEIAEVHEIGRREGLRIVASRRVDEIAIEGDT